jgi:protein-tyrosine phosphatase
MPDVLSAGGGRTGLVQAAWLASQGLEPQQAADAVTAYAASNGLSRRVDVQALQEFLKAAGV